MNTTSRLATDERFRPLSSEVTGPRERTQATAQRLSLLAIRNWEKAVTGVVALPAAAALSTATTVLFTVSILERTFEMLESTLSDMGQRVGVDFDASGEPRRDGKEQPS